METDKRAVRVVKRPEVRRSELVDCAQSLFLTKGYEATTIADIIARAGVSKGGFYHHFLSKEDLLDALIARMTEAIIANAQDVLDDGRLDALAKLNLFFSRSQQWKAQSAPALWPLVSAMFRPENAQLYQRMVRSAVTAVGPVLTRIVEQGMREGTFDAPDASLVAELLLHLNYVRQSILADVVTLIEAGDIDKGVALIEGRLRKEESVVDRLLGLRPGSFKMFDAAALRDTLRVLRGS